MIFQCYCTSFYYNIIKRYFCVRDRIILFSKGYGIVHIKFNRKVVMRSSKLGFTQIFSNCLPHCGVLNNSCFLFDYINNFRRLIFLSLNLLLCSFFYRTQITQIIFNYSSIFPSPCNFT